MLGLIAAAVAALLFFGRQTLRLRAALSRTLLSGGDLGGVFMRGPSRKLGFKAWHAAGSSRAIKNAKSSNSETEALSGDSVRADGAGSDGVDKQPEEKQSAGAEQAAKLDDISAVTTVFYFHGLGGSRLECFGRASSADSNPSSLPSLSSSASLEEDANQKQVMCIGIDRPGFGLSTVIPGRRYRDFADDVIALADHLGIQRFAVCGFSSGGCYALACARFIPSSRLIKTVLVNSDPPWIETPWRYYNLNHAILFACTRLPASLFVYPALVVISSLAGAVLALSAQTGMLRKVADVFASGEWPLIQEMYMERSDWGFRLEDIQGPVSIFYGTKDDIVPSAAATYIASRIPHAKVLPQEGENHFMIGRIWPQIMAECASRK